LYLLGRDSVALTSGPHYGPQFAWLDQKNICTDIIMKLQTETRFRLVEQEGTQP
jgi:hypothetical protein